MMRRFYALLSLVVALLMSIGAWADSLQIGNTFTADGILYQVSNNNPNEVSVGVTWWIDGKYHEELVDVKAIKTDTVGVVDIPSSVIGTDGQSYSVTSIQYRAFRGCSGITDVSIGDNIRTIDEGAFMECEQLKSVSIPASVISIDKQAFAYTHLETISIPNSITKLAESIFAHDIYLTSVYIPSSVTSIGENAFYNCHSLPSIVIPGSVKAIGAEAFHDCDGLTVVTSLIEEPFSLVSEKFGFPVEVFGTKSYNATLYVPAGTKAKYEATEGWKEFKNIVEMESENKDLKVGDTFVAGGITYRVTNSDQKEVMVGYKEPYSDIAVNKDTTGIIIIPSTIIGSDESTYSVTGIQDYAFEGCNKLTGVIIPENITIGEGVFNGCSNLTNVNIPESLKIIQPLTFRNCSSLQTVYIPESVKEIGYAAFDGCKALNSVNIPIGITNIARATFQSCESLTCIDIPSTVTSIGEAAFNICGLKSIIIPEGVTSIGRAAFSDCWQAEDIIIPSSVTSIGEVAFSRGYSHLTKVTSYMTNPVPISYNTFGQNNYDSYTYATLYVPAGTKAKYEATEGWKEFKNIVEMVELDPIDGETTVSTDNLGNENLSDNVVNDIYYNVGAEGYDSSDKSVVNSQTTNMGQITDATPGSSEVKENFNGMILKVAAGKGTITLNVKTTGNAQLVVQVGNQTPMIASKTEQGDVVVSYDVAEDTYVYIYAIIGSSAAPAHRAAPADAVKIYSIKVTPGATGIDTVHSAQSTVHSCYTLDGRKLEGQPTKKGVYIINGKKIVIR